MRRRQALFLSMAILASATYANAQQIAAKFIEKTNHTIENVVNNTNNFQAATVEKILDGDTALLNRNGKLEYCRLIGYDSPEKIEPGYNAAGEALRHKIQGKTVFLEQEETKFDIYGRTLAHLHLIPNGKDESVNLQMAKEGWGKTLSIAPNTKYSTQFATAVANAKIEKKGMWSISYWQRGGNEHPGCPKNTIVVGSKHSKIFHRPGSRFAKRIRGENVECFKSIQEAEDAGYIAARRFYNCE